MSNTKSREEQTNSGLGHTIDEALKKIGSDSENDICRYLPIDGGYMHHFTLRKMKNEVPEELSSMIDRFIIRVEQPAQVPPKPRAARGSRKRGDQPNLNQEDLKRLLNIARLANDQEMIRKLTPQRSLPGIKRELMKAIRQGKADHDLWSQYVEAVDSQYTGIEASEQNQAPELSVSWKDLPGMN
jgi:hypothetical protein